MWSAILLYSVLGLVSGTMLVIAFLEYARSRAKHISLPKPLPVRRT